MSTPHPLAALVDPAKALTLADVRWLLEEGHDIATLALHRATRASLAHKRTLEGVAA